MVRVKRRWLIPLFLIVGLAACMGQNCLFAGAGDNGFLFTDNGGFFHF